MILTDIAFEKNSTPKRPHSQTNPDNDIDLYDPSSKSGFYWVFLNVALTCPKANLPVIMGEVIFHKMPEDRGASGQCHAV